jgi:uncharacterized protein YodC (DUF2158 family)
MSISIGTVVQLKTGGPKMTVSKIDYDNDLVKVQWFEGTDLKEAKFRPGNLQPILNEQILLG